MSRVRTEIGARTQKRLTNLRAGVPSPAKDMVRPLRDWSVALWHRLVHPGFARRLKRYDRSTMPEASILLVTYNRVRMLRECLTSLLEKTHGDDFEIIVWNNGSDDGTREFLDELAPAHPGLCVVHHPKNVGLNGVALSVELARGFYVVELDDDVVRFPDDWLAKMIHAFKTVPKAGYLATNVVQDERTDGNKRLSYSYTPVEYGGIVVEHGPTWGWCTMTSLEVLCRVGNFPRRRGRVFFCEDGDYGRRCQEAGFKLGIVQDVMVYHAAGEAANDDYGYLDLCLQKYSDGPEYVKNYSRTQRYAEGQDAPRE